MSLDDWHDATADGFGFHVERGYIYAPMRNFRPWWRLSTLGEAQVEAAFMTLSSILAFRRCLFSRRRLAGAGRPGAIIVLAVRFAPNFVGGQWTQSPPQSRSTALDILSTNAMPKARSARRTQ